jgi:hypothetical protein
MTDIEETYKQSLNDALKKFNIAFQEYQIKCASNQYNIQNQTSKLCDFSMVEPSYNELMKVVNDALTVLNSKHLEEEYNKLLCLRERLDEQFKEFQNKDKETYYSEKFDSTLYTKILWTLLAVSLVFYSVLKMK